MQSTTSVVSPYVQILLRNMGFSQTLVGVFLACGQIAATVVPLEIGVLVDRKGSVKRTIFICLGCTIAAFLCLLFKLPVFPLAVLYTISQAAFKCFDPILDSYFTSAFKGDPATYSNVRASGTIGYVIMLTIFALTGFPSKDSNVQIICNIVLYFLIFGFFVAIAPKPVASEKDKDEGYERFRLGWLDKSFYVLIVIISFSKIAMGIIDIMLGSYMTEVLHLGDKFALFVAFGAFCEFFVFLIFGNLLKKNKITIWGLLMLSFIGIFVRLTIYYTTSSIAMFLVAQSLHGFAFGCNHIAATSYISKTVNPKHRNFAMSIYFAVAINFCNMLGVLFGGMLIDMVGYSGVFKIYSILPLISIALCIYFKKLINSKLI